MAEASLTVSLDQAMFVVLCAMAEQSGLVVTREDSQSDATIALSEQGRAMFRSAGGDPDAEDAVSTFLVAYGKELGRWAAQRGVSASRNDLLDCLISALAEQRDDLRAELAGRT